MFFVLNKFGTVFALMGRVHLKLKKEEVVLHSSVKKIAETHSNNTNTVINFKSTAERLLD